MYPDVSWTTTVDTAVDSCLPALVEVRRHLHAHPEPSRQERETTRYLRDFLLRQGFKVGTGPGDLGLVVEEPDAETGPCVALRADLDALWIHDEKSVEYRSRVPGIMHACGHDGHTATIIGAILALRALRQSGRAPGPLRWRAIFQPAEETSQGALAMIEAGVLEGVQAIFGLHMDPSRSVGQVGLRAGHLTAACDEMVVRIRGRGGHAARPHESIDPIAAAAQLISSIYLFVPRAIDSQEPVVVTFGEIRGGQNANVIPEEVRLRGTLRTLGGAIRDLTQEHIRKLARGLAETSGTRIEVSFERGAPPVCNEQLATEIVRRAARDVVGAEQVIEIGRPSMGSEDFAFYLERVPGSMFRLGCRSSRATGHALHSPLFDLDERALGTGARILARAVVLSLDAGAVQGGESR